MVYEKRKPRVNVWEKMVWRLCLVPQRGVNHTKCHYADGKKRLENSSTYVRPLRRSTRYRVR